MRLNSAIALYNFVAKILASLLPVVFYKLKYLIIQFNSIQFINVQAQQLRGQL
jgi:hypothetical protein